MAVLRPQFGAPPMPPISWDNPVEVRRWAMAITEWARNMTFAITTFSIEVQNAFAGLKHANF